MGVVVGAHGEERQWCHLGQEVMEEEMTSSQGKRLPPLPRSVCISAMSAETEKHDLHPSLYFSRQDTAIIKRRVPLSMYRVTFSQITLTLSPSRTYWVCRPGFKTAPAPLSPAL